jgi:tetratricopeptide (TPR) repeat protein
VTENESLALPGGEQSPDLAPQPGDDDEAVAQFFAQCEELMSQGGAAMASADFTTAVERFGQVEDFVGSALGEAADELPPDLRAELLKIRMMATAWKEFSTGIENLRGRTPTVAARAFQRAAPLFREISESLDDPDFAVFAEYAEINEQAAHGLEELVRLNFSSAAAAFQFALGRIEIMIDETLPPLLARDDPSAFMSALRAGLDVDRPTYQAAFELASLRELSAKGDFDSALPHAVEREKLLRQTFDALPAVFPRQLKVLVEAAVQLASAEANMTEAHMWREKAEWDKALASYRQARSVMQKSAAVIAKSRFPEAAAIQESLLNQAANVTVMELQCKRQQQSSKDAQERERRLQAELDRERSEFKSFQNAIFAALKSTGSVTNNTTLDLTNAVRQTATVSQQMTVSVRNAFGELRSDAEKAPLPPEVKAKILEKADEAIQLAERGTDALDRVKELGRQVFEIIKAAGPAASLLLPAARGVAMVLQIPFPF